MSKYLIIFFVLGIIFRLWFTNLVPQPFVFDQTEYQYFAQQMLQKGLFAWSARLYGYPLFLAIIYKLFGLGNFTSVAAVQAILDSTTGILIYLIGRKIFKNKIIAIICCLVYLFNPFTASFISLLLSEILTIFLMSLIAYLFVLFLEKKKTWIFLTLVILLGFIPQVRPSFLFYSIILASFLIYTVTRTKMFAWKLNKSLIFTLFYLIPFIYNVFGNWIYFRQVSPTTVDNLFVRELYISLYLPGRFSIHPKSTDVYPKEVQNLYNEYSSQDQNNSRRAEVTKKYLNLSLQKIVSDPAGFILSRLKKTWYVWEKHFIFLYDQPENSLIDFLTYWGNNLFLLMATLGFICWRKAKSFAKYSLWGWFTLFTIFYISLIHAFSATDERYSLPGYSLIFLFAVYGIWHIIKNIHKQR
ncbi:glycosyltransferase family 39 protein [Candidatus Gottesmanbacteria bacterium]|nr:glycosyltransferase family 39 protein [Candidatus Gottesmanbacteria bacterium]